MRVPGRKRLSNRYPTDIHSVLDNWIILQTFNLKEIIRHSYQSDNDDRITDIPMASLRVLAQKVKGHDSSQESISNH